MYVSATEIALYHYFHFEVISFTLPPFFFNFKIAWIFALLVNVFEKSHGKQKEELKLDSERFSFVMAVT